MEPEEQLRVFQEIEKEGLELSAIYHSHPHTAAFPSPRDVHYAFYSNSFILIISLMEKKVPQMKKGKLRKRQSRSWEKMKKYPDNPPEFLWHIA